jgi:type IV pilus assembly protein PilM
MAKGTGIEIGATAVTVAEIDGSPKKFRLVTAGRAPIEAAPPGEERIKAVSQAARAAMKSARASKEQVVVSVAAGDVIIREIQLPFTDEEQIRKVIKFESESHLHSCDIDDVVVAFQKFAESGPKSRVLVFAVKKDDIKNALDALDRIGIDPMHVTFDAAALFGLWRALPPGAGEGTNVILDVGEATTTALVTVGDRVRMARGLRLGTETITKAIASDLGVPPEEAREKTRQFSGKSSEVFALAGDLEEQQPSPSTSTSVLQRDIIRDSHGGFAMRLANEIRRSLSSVLLDGKVEAIWLTGSGAAAPGLEGALTAAFDVPVRTFDALEGVEHKAPPEMQAVVAVPIGLALKALGHDPLSLDFRQEEFKFSRKFDRVKWVLAMGLGLSLFLFVFLLIHEMLEGRAIGDRQRGVAEMAKDRATKRYFPLISDKTHARILDATDKKPDDIRKQLDAAPTDRVVAEVAKHVRESGGILERKFGYKPGEGASSQEVAASALTRLSQWVACFKNKPEMVGRFAINRLFISSTEISWDMDLADERDWSALEACFKQIPDATPERPAVRPAGAQAQPGLNFRMEGCKLTWPREGK